MKEAFIFAFCVLAATLALRFYLKKRGVVNPTPTSRADYWRVLKLLSLVPVVTIIIMTGFLLKRRLETRVWPITTIFYREGGRLYGMVVEQYEAPPLPVRNRARITTLPFFLQVRFQRFDFSAGENVDSLSSRPFFQTALLDGLEMRYLGRQGRRAWIRSEAQGVLAVNAMTLAVIDEAAIAEQNPDFSPRTGDSGFDPSRALPFFAINETRYDLSEDSLALRRSPFRFPTARQFDTGEVSADVSTVYSCDGRLSGTYRAEITNAPNRSQLQISRWSQNRLQIVLRETIAADHIAGFCLDTDQTVFVVFARGSTFPEYAWQRFNQDANGLVTP